jgi:transcriptional regulator NrdR family protein
MDEVATSEKQKGLECWRGGCRQFFVDRTKAAKNMIIRYRHCRQCGQRVVTTERIAGRREKDTNSTQVTIGDRKIDQG